MILFWGRQRLILYIYKCDDRTCNELECFTKWYVHLLKGPVLNVQEICGGQRHYLSIYLFVDVQPIQLILLLGIGYFTLVRRDG